MARISGSSQALLFRKRYSAMQRLAKDMEPKGPWVSTRGGGGQQKAHESHANLSALDPQEMG